jgi:hypothetical protein
MSLTLTSLLGASLLMSMPVASSGESALSEFKPVDTHNYVIGTQTFGSKYQFTEKSRLLETAEQIEEMGSNLIKFRLGPRFAEDNYAGPKPGRYTDLVDLARNEPSIRAVFDMPFAYYFVWAHPMQECRWGDEDGYTRRDAEIEYEEIYNLTRYLLTTYAGSGKAFYFGNWEGDWLLLRGYDRTSDPDPARVEAMVQWQNNRQKAVDDAKRDTPHEGVEVYHYLELVLVEKGIRGLPCVATEVLPRTNVDFVSYSAYEMQTDRDLPAAMERVLGFLQSKLPPKPGLPEKRVFIGEFGYQANTEGATMQVKRSLEFMQAALAWGSPFILQWQLYDNEFVESRGFKGYFLIDYEGRKWPIYSALETYYKQAREWVKRKEDSESIAPSDFTAAALKMLQALEPELSSKVEYERAEGFESGAFAPWKVPGFGAEISSENPASGEYHLVLSATGSPEAWSAASLVKSAGAGEVWEASVSAARIAGPLTKLKLAFHNAEGRMIRTHNVSSVDSSYETLSIKAAAPDGTAEVHLVLAVEFGSQRDPVVAHFDDARLVRMAD